MTKTKGNQLIKGHPIKVLTTASIATLMLGTGVASNYANAQDIHKYDKNHTVPDANEKADAKYAVIANFNKDTKLVPFGVKYKDTNWNTNSTASDKEQKTYHFTDASKLPKDLGMKYTNVATHDGKKLDLKITVKGAKNFTDSDKLKAISFGKNDIAFDFSALEYADLDFQYVWHDSGKNADISGQYMNILDLDNSQYVDFDKDTTSKIGKIYTDKTAEMDASENNGRLKIADLKNRAIKDNDKTGRFHSHARWNYICVSNGCDYKNVAENEGYSVDSLREQLATIPSSLDSKLTGDSSWAHPTKTGKDYGGNEHFLYSGKKPVATKTLKPSKKVTDSDEKNVNENALKNFKEEYQYDISHTVPDESSDFYYKDYKMTDTLIPELEKVGDVKVTDEDGKDVTSKFTDNSKGNTIEMEAKTAELGKAAFYGHDYKFTFKTKIKKGADLTKYFQKDKYELPNSATVKIGNDTNTTNKTKTTVKKIRP